jgi:CubicO group peptidase (beta-lactamase class C family)
MDSRLFLFPALCRLALPLLVACFCVGQRASAQAPAAAIALPGTPAGTQLDAFLAAFNTGDQAKLKTYAKGNVDGPPNDPGFADGFAAQQFTLFGQTGGLVMRKVVKSQSAAIKVAVQAKTTGFWMNLSLFITAQPPDYVTAAPPYHVVGVGVGDIEAPVEFLPRTRLTDAQLKANIDSLMNTLVAKDAFSGIVYVARDAKPVYARAFGLANKSWNAPNRIDTRFNLASITKMFTAVAVAQLVEQGKLSYTDTVGKLLPDYPNKEVAAKVTVHHLLSHTSGMIGGRALVEKVPNPPMTLRTIDEMAKLFVSEPLSFPPGQQFDYSNAGFILLGKIIERVSGQTYYDYVRDHIFRPAGMTSTDFIALDSNPRNIATGFKDGPNGTRLDNIFDLGVIGSPAGGAYSTGADLTRFQQALVAGKLLSKPAREKLWTGVTEEPERNSEYGYGAEIAQYNGARIVGHGGGWQGITNRFEMYPDLGYTVVILSNYDDDPNAIADKLREWLTQGPANEKQKPSAPPALTLDASVSSATVAKGSPVTITVTAKNGGGAAHASVIDLEVKDAKGAKANQQFNLGQRIDPGHARAYTYVWTPTEAGTYTVDVGAFGPDWQPKYQFASGVATITVQ